MTLFDFQELTAYWVEHPPVHILVGAYLGVGKHQHKSIPFSGSRPDRAPSSARIVRRSELGSGFGAGDVHAGLPGVVLDFSELRRRVRSSD